VPIRDGGAIQLRRTKSIIALAVGAAMVVAVPAAATRRPATRRVATTSSRGLQGRAATVVPGEVLVRFTRSVGRADAARIVRASGGRVATRLKTLDIDIVHLPRSVGVASAVDGFRSNPLVLRAEPNQLIYPSVEVVPNDPLFPNQWGLRNVGQQHPIGDRPPPTASGSNDADIDAGEAWGTTQGSPETVIAVVDSGVDVDHPDLAANIWTNPGEIPANGIDDDGNGYTDDVHGWDFAENDDSLLETDSSIAGYEHGTHVAGIAAAQSNNAQGIAGVCPVCKVMVLKFMKPIDTNSRPGPDTMVGDLAAELEAIDYAIGMGADVFNGSYNTILYSQLERSAFQRLGSARVLSVLAAGNGALDNDMLVSADVDGDGRADFFSPAYPASYNLKSILSVTASNHKDEYGYFTGCVLQGNPKSSCAFADWGHDSVDLAAPGVDIQSTVPGGYATFDGSSMAAPIASGVAGLVESAHPDYGPERVKNVIMNSVDHPANLQKLSALSVGAPRGRFTRTSGRLNANTALFLNDISQATRKTDGNVNGARKIQGRARGHLAWPHDVNDVYRRRLRRGRRYKVSLDGPRGKDFDLVVYKPGTKEIWQVEPSCFALGRRGCKIQAYPGRQGTADESTRFKAGRTGIFYFQASAWILNRGRYTLKVRRLR
jgi:subtilisin family serine protease